MTKHRKLRIFTISDLHGDTAQVKKLAEKSESKKADLVIIAGDLSYFDEHAEGMVGPFLNHKREVVFVPGNHDIATTEWVEKKYKIKNLQKEAIVKNGVGFFGCGGANVGINYMEEDDVFKYLERGFEYVKDSDVKIMVTHVHPKGSDIEKVSSFEGSSAVTKAIMKFKPDFHICGHIHEAEGMEEKIGNTTVICTGKKGKILDIY